MSLVRPILTMLAVVSTTLLAPALAHAGGDLDSTFGSGGYATDLVPGGPDAGASHAVLDGSLIYSAAVVPSSGTLLVSANEAASGAGVTHRSIAMSDVGLDPAGYFAGSARLVAGPRLYVAATAVDDTGTVHVVVVALRRNDLAWDTSFNTHGYASVDTGMFGSSDQGVGALAIGQDGDFAGDGSIWVAGQADRASQHGDGDLFVAQLTSDGDPASSFSVDGVALIDTDAASIIDQDSVIGLKVGLESAAVGFRSVVGTARFGIVQLDDTGNVMGGPGIATLAGDMNAMHFTGPGLLFAGSMGSGGSQVPVLVNTDMGMAANTSFSGDGIADFPSLGAGEFTTVAPGSGVIQRYFALGVRTDGRPVAAGFVSNGAPLAGLGVDGAAALVLPGGASSFEPRAFMQGPDQTLYGVGAMHNATMRFGAMRLTAPGSGSSGGGSTPGGGGTTPSNETTPVTTTPVTTTQTGFVFPAVSITQGAVYAPSKVVSMPNVRPKPSGANRFTSVDDAKAKIDGAGIRAKYTLVGVARTAVTAKYRKAITPGGVFVQSPAPGTKTKVTTTSLPTAVLLRYYDPAKDPKDPKCDYANANRDLTDVSQSTAVSWLIKNKCEYVLRTIPTRGTVDRYVLRAKVEKSTLPGGKILVVDLADPVLSDFVFGFRESRNAGSKMSFDVRDWALTSGSTQNTFTVQVLERLTGRFVQGVTVEVSYREAGAVAAGTRRLVTNAQGEVTFQLLLPVPGTLRVDAIVYGRNGRNMEGDTNIPVKTRTGDVWTTGGRRLVKAGSGWKLQSSAAARRPISSWNQLAAAVTSMPPLEYGRLDALAADQVAPILRLAQVNALAIALTTGMRIRFEDALKIAQSSVPPVSSFRTMLLGTGMTPIQLSIGGSLLPGTSGPSLVNACPGITNVNGTMRNVSGTCVDLNPSNATGEIVMGSEGVIAAGSGNANTTDSSNVIAAGGGNATNSGVAQVISAGGANVISAGGGNIIGSAAGNLIGPAGGNLIGPAAGNMMPTYGGSLMGGRP